MKKELISELFEKFEEACYNLDGLECWSGRELMSIFNYSEWRSFFRLIQSASKSCESSGEQISDHFVVYTKMHTCQPKKFIYLIIQYISDYKIAV